MTEVFGCNGNGNINVRKKNAVLLVISKLFNCPAALRGGQLPKAD